MCSIRGAIFEPSVLVTRYLLHDLFSRSLDDLFETVGGHSRLTFSAASSLSVPLQHSTVESTNVIGYSCHIERETVNGVLLGAAHRESCEKLNRLINHHRPLNGWGWSLN